MSKIDWKKPIQFVENPDATVRYFCHDGPRAVVAFEVGGRTCYSAYAETGRPWNYPTAGDKIENVPPPKVTKTVLLILWKDGSTGLRTPDWQPTGAWGTNLIAKKLVTITEGEGLDG